MRSAPDIAAGPRWHLQARRLRRLRLYSYCLTLLACVMALLAFMYLAQGLADRDGSFAALGAGFVVGTGAALWGAVLVTHAPLPRPPVVHAVRPVSALRPPGTSASAA
ncbi:MAG: hypothetical protein ACT4PP_04400 [Sporichthyaceae bacterium]